MPPKEKYSDPKLRDEVKEEIHNGDKGGAPGQWSARKAQMMAAEYKKRGGGYNTDKSEQDESQKHLSEWGEEEWQTKDGSGDAKQEDGTQKRYLPKKAWEQMSEKEKEETDQKKQEGSKEGKQFVGNTQKAKESRENANEEEHEQYEKKKEQEKKAKKNESKDAKEDDDAEEDGDAEYQEEAEEDEQEDDNDDDEDDQADGEEEKAGGKKRTRGQQNGSNKSQKNGSNSSQSKSNGNKNSSNGQSKKEEDDSNKSNGTVGSKHMKDEDPAPKGSADRLPKKGQSAQWKALPGFVAGKVEDILTEEQEVDGKKVKASEKDPRIVLKSDSSGKICVHKPEACYYD